MITQAAIEDHGLIGDLQTAALVATDGTIDWYCCPRFDSPSIFAAILDAQKGGHFRIAPDTTESRTKQLYLPGTAILVTRFIMPDGVGEVTDFMPPKTGAATEAHDLVRLVRATRGRVGFRLDCQPRFNYGRDKHEVIISDEGVVFQSDAIDLTLAFVPSPQGDARDAPKFERQGDGVGATIVLNQGQVGGVVLRSGQADARHG